MMTTAHDNGTHIPVPGGVAKIQGGAPPTLLVAQRTVRGDRVTWNLVIEEIQVTITTRPRAIADAARALARSEEGRRLPLSHHLILALLTVVPDIVTIPQQSIILVSRIAEMLTVLSAPSIGREPSDESDDDTSIHHCLRDGVLPPHHDRATLARFLIQGGLRIWSHPEDAIGVIRPDFDRDPRKVTMMSPKALDPGTEALFIWIMAAALVWPWSAIFQQIRLKSLQNAPTFLDAIDRCVELLDLLPGPEPRPWERLADIHSDLEREKTYAFLQAEYVLQLVALAQALATAIERPLPRLIGRTLQVVLPRSLRPLLAQVGLSAITVHIVARGMWVEVMHPDDPHTLNAIVWWEPPTPGDSMRIPLSIGPARWAVLNLVLSALWHDLHKQAMIINEPQPPAPPRTASSDPSPPRTAPRRSIMVVPPVISRRTAPSSSPTTVQWSDTDQDAVTTYRHLPPRYRILPAGWEQRVDRPDFIKRTAAAADRAQSDGWDPPPPGMTYVRAFVRRVGGTGAQTPPPPKVIARGLLALSIALDTLPISPSPQPDDTGTDRHSHLPPSALRQRR